ncbi:hypothetical protein [uncultured Psychroserpens sp.]|uniref:hypothetical protein n=1 Tax=uncultured Psychroserpens sp. TaxID=255436 RepID=UPI002621894A|nr:hypothetical protein [uncultured Psychroserpens sp.]
MKTRHLLSIVLVLLFIGNTTVSAQQLFENDTANFNSFTIPSELIDIRTYEISLDEEILYDFANSPKSITEYEAQEEAVAYVMNMIAFGAGFGFTDAETLWCLHAAYYLRLAMLNNSALYGSLGVGYNYTNAEFLTVGLLDITLKALMFSVLSKRYQQVRAQYGIFAKYGFGTNKFEDGFKTDITRLSLGVLVGLHILLSPQWSLMVQTNILTYQEQTTTSGGSEFKDNQTFGLINKNNLLLLSLVFTLPNSRR